MASSSVLVMRVRRRVHDAIFDEAQKLPHYGNEVYTDALSRGLIRVNLNLGTNYSIANVPTKVEYLVELRTTIEMCFIRGAEGATGDVSDTPDLAVQSITLPKGFTQSTSQMSYEGARFWRNLATTLEKEYSDLLDDVQNAINPAQGAVTMGVIQRISNRTRRATSYVYDRPLTAPDISVSVARGDVVIAWEPLLTEYLEHYAIERSSTLDFQTKTQLFITHDNQVRGYTDKSVPAGTHYYRLVVTNTNQLTSVSPTAEVLV